LQPQYGVQNNAEVLWDQLKKNYEWKVKPDDWASLDQMSVVKLRDSENVQKHALKIQGYVNDFNLHVESYTGTMPKSEHSYNLMQDVPMDDDWRFFTQLMYNKIVALANKLVEIAMNMEAHEALQQQEVDVESIECLALAKTMTTSEKWN